MEIYHDLIDDRRVLPREGRRGGRRRYPRVDVPLRATYQSAAMTIFVNRADLSLRGMFLGCSQCDAVGTRAVLHLSLPERGNDAPLVVEAEVAWVSTAADEGPGMGVRFVGLSDADRRTLTAFLLRRKGLVV